METAAQDLREMRQMASLLKGAAARAAFHDCAAILLAVAELLERRIQALAAESKEASLLPAPPPRACQPVDIRA